MPQKDIAWFRGHVALLRTVEESAYDGQSYCGPWQMGGVVDALHFGMMFPDVVREYKQVFAIGSLGPVSDAPACDLRRFCPCLFVFSDDREASVVLGIERLERRGDHLVIPKDAKILAVQPE